MQVAARPAFVNTTNQPVLEMLCPYIRQKLASEAARRILEDLGMIEATKVKFAVMLLKKDCNSNVGKVHWQETQNKMAKIKKAYFKPLSQDFAEMHRLLANAIWPKIAEVFAKVPHGNEILRYHISKGTQATEDFALIAAKAGIALQGTVQTEVYSLLPKDYSISIQAYSNVKSEPVFMILRKSEGIVFETDRFILPKAML